MFLALSLMVELKNRTIRKRGPIKFQKINPLPGGFSLLDAGLLPGSLVLFSLAKLVLF